MKLVSLSGVLLIGLFLQGCGGDSGTSTTPPDMSSFAQSSSSAAATGSFAKGADVSWITEMEASGKKFYTKVGVEKDIFTLLKDYGMDSIRLRVWVNPASPKYNDAADVLAKAKRAQAAGMRLMVDFHYSDTWADPTHQIKPAAWSPHTVDQLAAAITQHTKDTLVLLRDAGITPEWVQVGNETNNGMLWNEGKAESNMANYARFVTSGHDAAKEIFPSTLVIVHVSNCHDNGLFKWNIGGLKANNAKFDIIGASNYPTTLKDENNKEVSWKDVNADCLENLNDMVSTYKLPVMIVETGVAFGHSDSKAIVADLITKVRSVSGGKGLGVFYWEPQAFGGWKNYGMGAFDTSGKPGTVMDAFLE